MKRLVLILTLACTTTLPVSTLPTLAATPVPTLASAPVPNLDTPSKIARVCLVVTAAKSLYLRSGPSTALPVSSWLDTGRHITGLASVGEWWLVDTGTNFGYVHSAYVKECNVHSKAQSKRR